MHHVRSHITPERPVRGGTTKSTTLSYIGAHVVGSRGDAKENPEIKAGDLVYVPTINRPDVIGSIWQSWGLFGIVQAIIPGARLR